MQFLQNQKTVKAISVLACLDGTDKRTSSFLILENMHQLFYDLWFNLAMNI